MNRLIPLFSIILVGLLALGCSGAGQSAVAPGTSPGLTTGMASGQDSNTHLWGYWDIFIDPDTLTAEAVSNRSAMFTANVTNPLNKKPAGIQIAFNGLTNYGTHIDVDLDLSITHPFPGNPAINGYDVRGVFMGDGSGTLGYNTDLVYSADGTDQMMLPDPGDNFGGPDGYTRWFNIVEFSEGGPPLFSYTPGNFASKIFNGTATINAYKYFADGLGPNDNLYDWMHVNWTGNGVFSSGSTNSRNMYLRFPAGKGLVFGYAIIANWEGADPGDHPSNAAEPVAVKIVDTSDVWFLSNTENGGDLVFDITVFDWNEHTVTGAMEDYTIFLESTVLSTTHQFDTTEMTPTNTDGQFYTYHVELPADNITSADGNDYWIIIGTADYDYTNPFGVPNLAGTDDLAGLFRFPLIVSTVKPCEVPEVLGIDPPSAVQDSVFSATISCVEVEDGACLAATLERGGTDVIAGYNVAWVDPTTITCDFDLTGVTLGSWDVNVINGCCSDPGVGPNFFEVLEPLPGYKLISSGDLPNPLPTADVANLSFCVVGDDSFGNAGVFYHYSDFTPDNYQAYKYPLDYSADGVSHVSWYMPWIDPGNLDDFVQGPQYMAALEVTPNGSSVFTSAGPGQVGVWDNNPVNAIIWWCDGSTDGATPGTKEITNGTLYYEMQAHDIETEFASTGSIWSYWGNNPNGVDGATIRLDSPYDVHAAIEGFYIADHVGSIDGEVSDNEAYKLAVDSDPQDISFPQNRIMYFMEGAPDDPGIEVVASKKLDPADPLPITTIDDALVGTPVDISCINSFENINTAVGNWVCVLEDNGDNTWQVSAFDQNGVLIDRYLTPIAGTPIALDCDNTNLRVHVWVDDGGTLKYYIFGF